MAKKNRRGLFFKVSGKVFLLILNILVALGLLFTFLTQWIKPSTSIWIAFSGLGFTYLILANFVFIILWLFLKRSFTLISLIAITININNIDRHYQLNAAPKPESCCNCITVMSYNVKLFGLYDSEDPETRNKGKSEILHYIANKDPDILCFQEYFYDKSGKLNFTTTEAIDSILNKPNLYTYFPYNRNNQSFYGFATFCKYRVVNSGPVWMPDSQTVVGIYIDFKYKGDTIRNYNINLASNYFEPVDYETGRQIFENDIRDSMINKRAMNLFKKMQAAVLKREEQAIVLAEHIKSSPHKVIVCGDLNDPPASYSYHKISRKLKDSFRESGKGSGKTYHHSSYPDFRIDNIFHSKELKSFGHTVSTEIEISDHYPIFCYISLCK